VFAMIRYSALLLCIVLVTVSSVIAGQNPNSKVAVHVLPHEPDRACRRNFPAIENLCDINATYEGCGNIDVFPVFYDLVQYQGLEYGLEWPGSYSCVYTVCSDSHLWDIVWPGDGTSQIWGECRTGAVAIAGWGWITTDVPGLVRVVGHPASGHIIVGGCNTKLDTVAVTYAAGVCGAAGEGPCGPGEQAVAAATWGGIKGIFR
jgi:hypothetical protein